MVFSCDTRYKTEAPKPATAAPGGKQSVCVCVCHTKIMSFALGVLVDVFFGKAGKEDTMKAGVESVEVGTAHVADTWLGLKKSKRKEQKQRLRP